MRRLQRDFDGWKKSASSSNISAQSGENGNFCWLPTIKKGRVSFKQVLTVRGGFEELSKQK
ncbi:hypothetical protein LQF67_00800 [Tetragenococcus halophilus]|uniref:hypothetical protein n=1 Tax=Tetragenococcus halophilus TaxID=51669 RepID=UPI001F271D71|nr:hypothetical protein [Tetragenococcus halophilus]MCF1684120.1 hypothetical protein [Tetragenococcus halophilus]